MDFAFSDEQEELRSTARDFLAEHAPPDRVRAAMESDSGFDPELWKQIGELGWTALLVPEEYGGLGLSWVELVALLEVCGESLLCAPLFSTVCLGQSALMQAGTTAQKARWLPALAEGRQIATLAFTESNARWDASGVEAVARREADGWVLSGRKTWVPDGHVADLLIVAAREGETLRLFCVPADTPGLTREALGTLDQTRRQANVSLDEVSLPTKALMDGGEAALEKILQLAAIALSAEQVGGAQRCLDQAVAYAKERIQFGRPIGSFQAIKHKCADMMVMVESARSASYYAACVAAEAGDALSVVSSLAKAVASDTYFRCAAESLQIHGGVGFTWEYDVHLYFKRAKSSETLLGDATWHRERVARQIGLEGAP